MKRIFSRWFFFLLLALTACGPGVPPSTPQPLPNPTSLPPVAAVDSSFPPGSALRFTTLSVEEGLSQSVVHTIAQDRQGFLWLGTQDGLNRYDGDSFKIYKPEPGNPRSLSDGWVLALLVDTEGFLWVGTHQGGLNRFDPGTGAFTRFQHDPLDPASLTDGEVTALYQDQTGAIWVGTSQGLNRLTPDGTGFIRFVNDPQNPASLSDNRVTSLFQASAGQFWVGTQNGLNLFEPATGEFRIFRNNPRNLRSLSDNGIAALAEDAQGSLWVATHRGLNRYNPYGQTFARYFHQTDQPDSLMQDNLTDLLVDRGGTLWIGTYGGLDRYDPEGDRFLHYRHNPLARNSLSSEIVYSLYEDRGGVLWIGTWGGGVNQYDRGQEKFTYYRHEPGQAVNGLPDGSVWALLPESDGTVWIGYYGGGLARFDLSLGRVVEAYTHDETNPATLASPVVFALLRDRQGALWVGTADGLDRLNEADGTFAHYRSLKSDPASLGGSQVYKLHEDRAGDLWIGMRQGLDRYDPASGAFIHYTLSDDPERATPRNVVDILEDRDGQTLWFATLGDGLYRLDLPTGRFTRLVHDKQNPASLPNDLLLGLSQDEQGRLWVATAGSGLSLYDPASGHFTTYTEADGLPNNFVYCALPDSQGQLWLSTNYGVSKFDPRAGSFENFTQRDGLQSNEFNQGACARGPDGAFYLGGGAGWNRFIPAGLRSSAYQPPVALTSITNDGQPLALAGTVETVREITLEWPQNSFEFEFAALSFAQPRQNRYAYLLENFDTAWNYIDTKRDGRYTNLPGGEYTLRLKAANSDGVWNENALGVKVTVIPPFWQTWWFYALIGLSAIGAVLGGIRLRVHNIEAHRRELEREVQERTREIERLFEQTKELAVIEERNRLARELHDSAKQKAFAALAQLGTASGLVQNDMRAAKLHINEAENLVYDVIQELTFLIQEMYPLALKEKGLVTSLREYVFEWETRTDIPVSLQAEHETRLPLEKEQAIYRIAQESLANVARHSHATLAEVAVIYGAEAVELEVHDNGQGFDLARRPLGIGLRSMQERADSVGGRVSITSTPGGGTRIRATIPLNGRSKS